MLREVVGRIKGALKCEMPEMGLGTWWALGSVGSFPLLLAEFSDLVRN